MGYLPNNMNWFMDAKDLFFCVLSTVGVENFLLWILSQRLPVCVVRFCVSKCVCMGKVWSLNRRPSS